MRLVARSILIQCAPLPALEIRSISVVVYSVCRQVHIVGFRHWIQQTQRLVSVLHVECDNECLAYPGEHRPLRGACATDVRSVISAHQRLPLQFLIGGLLVPLTVTLGINNKIAFVEKFGTSEFQNTTGAYELDLTLTDNYKLAWREMHVKSDVFCSGTIVLPDRGARQLNVGGWSLDSTKGVRLYWPDGAAGVNGTHDWQENFQELKLQVRLFPRG